MTNIIALRGSMQSGKSSVIRILYRYLFEAGYRLVLSNYHDKGDFMAIFSKDGKHIGITSYKDSSMLYETINSFIESNCNLCVCTCDKSNGDDNCLSLNLLEANKCSVKYQDKLIANESHSFNSINQQDAKALIEEIEKHFIA